MTRRMERLARLRRQQHRPASNNNSFLVYNCVTVARDELPAAAEPSVPSVQSSVQSVFQRARKPTTRARRLPCLTHTQTTPEEPLDAATRWLWLKLTRYLAPRGVASDR